MDLVNRTSLNPICSSKSPINPLPNPGHPLSIAALVESRVRITKIYQACIVNELFKFFGLNVINKLSTTLFSCDPTIQLKSLVMEEGRL